MSEKFLLFGLDEISEKAPELIGVFTHYRYDEPYAFFMNGRAVVYGDAERSGDHIYLRDMHSVGTRQGNGKTFIRFLLEKGITEIIGESVTDAVPFWYKMGAKFNQNIFDQFLEEDDDDLLVPFTISAI